MTELEALLDRMSKFLGEPVTRDDDIEETVIKIMDRIDMEKDRYVFIDKHEAEQSLQDVTADTTFDLVERELRIQHGYKRST